MGSGVFVATNTPPAERLVMTAASNSLLLANAQWSRVRTRTEVRAERDPACWRMWLSSRCFCALQRSSSCTVSPAPPRLRSRRK
jgi:hypothetical protein